ncbi:LutC/YkgG family protein [Helicobacter bilis]|uniref:Lactate utilization protein C n=1 Tax=Helicobacter bilis TaxID=37372 RepID=A0A4U8U9I8_9HELI|nr:lactate utilization protein C [Helicobacter bilis]MCI7410307.1 lactate utilization protein C [Helicobacter bilis]MDD7296606.1 lactate utilization protein C [Helicobacter bilis]MDY4399038.1 lactate utilization protein C [Helicobacter bilis]TLE09255.1 lactate utilization protein C [Helicobacter bilis]TLE11286.1 lactate utilization protein C [Helicobacter bilis]
MSRDSILQAVREATRTNPIQSVRPTHFDTMIYDRKNLLSVYTQYQKANMAHLITTTKDSLANSINEIIKECDIKELLCAKNIANMQDSFMQSLETQTLLYDTSVDSMRDKLFSIEASILHAQVGVANLGIVGLGTNECNPRLASLVVKTCIILLHKDSIVPNLFSAFKILKTSGQDSGLPTNIVFLAGPSRTADIELQTVFGVHGPQNVYVVLYE